MVGHQQTDVSISLQERFKIGACQFKRVPSDKTRSSEEVGELVNRMLIHPSSRSVIRA